LGWGGTMRALLAATALAGLMLWPGPGHARDEMTGEFLQRCRTNFKSCTDSVNFSIGDPDFGQGCPPASVSLADATRAIVRWLSAYPQLAGEDKDRTIAMAANALWPCHNDE
jgi:hypothetical protein